MAATLPPLLPTPSERPDSDVVIYDGECVFCQSQVARLHRWDSRKRLSFVSLHDPLVAERYPDLTHDELMSKMYVISPEGARYGGGAAIQYLARRLPLMYPAYPILNLPFTSPLWAWIYNLIAKRRYKIAGRDCEGGACEIHFRN